MNASFYDKQVDTGITWDAPEGEGDITWDSPGYEDSYGSLAQSQAIRDRAFQSPLQNIAEGRPEANLEVSKGFLKGMGQTFVSGGIHRAGPVGAAMLANAPEFAQNLGAVDQFLQPSNPEQGYGMGTEMIAEMVLPADLLLKTHPIKGAQGALRGKLQNTISRDVDDLLKSTKHIARRTKEAMDTGTDFKKILSDESIFRGLKVEKGKIVPDEAIAMLDDRLDRLFETKRSILPALDKVVPSTKKASVFQRALEKIEGQQLHADEIGLIKRIQRLMAAESDDLTPSMLDTLRATARKSARDAKGLMKSSDEYAAIEHAARESLFDITDKLPISNASEFKALNDYMKQMIKTREFLDTVLRSQVVKGGRANNFLYRIIGGIAGSKGGPIGTAAGQHIGGMLSDIMTNNQLGSSFKLSLIKNITDDPKIIAEAQRLLEGVQDLKPLMLPPRMGGTPGTKPPIYVSPTGRAGESLQEVMDASFPRSLDDLPKYKGEVNTPKNTLEVADDLSDVTDTLDSAIMKGNGQNPNMDSGIFGRTKSFISDTLERAKKEGNRGFIKNPLAKSDDLATEARKYKSADEFVKAQGTPTFSGGSEITKVWSNEKIGGFGTIYRGRNELGGGIYISDSPEYAKTFGSKLTESSLKPNLKLFDVRESSKAIGSSKLDKIKESFDSYDWYLKNGGDDLLPTDYPDEILNKIQNVYGGNSTDILKKAGFDGIIAEESRIGGQGGTVWNIFDAKNLKTRSQLTDIWNKAQGGIDDLAKEAQILRGTKGMTAEDIMKTYPNIRLKKDVPAKDVYGNKVVIPDGEKLTPYELKDGKILLQDGQTYLVSKNQFQNIKGNSIEAVGKKFAPELEGLEETVKGEVGVKARQKAYSDFDAGLITREQRNAIIDAGGAPGTKYSQYTLPGGENYREILIKAPVEKPSGMSTADYAEKLRQGTFKSSHFPEDVNTISWIRLKNRTYKSKKVTFMEELQSDWAKEARKLGTDFKELPEGWKIVRGTGGQDSWRILDQNGTITRFKGATKEEAIKGFQNEKSVPNNPNLKNWQTLSIKRALKDAVDNDSDYFAWINGKQTSARYNLATHLEDVKWKSQNPNNPLLKGEGRAITLKPKSGSDIRVLIDEKGIVKETTNAQADWKGKKLDEVLGKGLADKIMEKESGTLAGEGLQFGGEWADNLYDRQVKNIVEDLTGQKVEIMDMGLPIDKKFEPWQVSSGKYTLGEDLTTKNMKVGMEIGQHGKEGYFITDILGDGKFKAVPKSWAEIKDGKWVINRENVTLEWLKENAETFDISQKTTQQMGIKLTPDVKAKIKGLAPKIETSGKMFEDIPN